MLVRLCFLIWQLTSVAAVTENVAAETCHLRAWLVGFEERLLTDIQCTWAFRGRHTQVGCCTAHVRCRARVGEIRDEFYNKKNELVSESGLSK
jgi:hypothetical protein